MPHVVSRFSLSCTIRIHVGGSYSHAHGSHSHSIAFMKGPEEQRADTDIKGALHQHAWEIVNC